MLSFYVSKVFVVSFIYYFFYRTFFQIAIEFRYNQDIYFYNFRQWSFLFFRKRIFVRYNLQAPLILWTLISWIVDQSHCAGKKIPLSSFCDSYLNILAYFLLLVLVKTQKYDAHIFVLHDGSWLARSLSLIKKCHRLFKTRWNNENLHVILIIAMITAIKNVKSKRILS